MDNNLNIKTVHICRTCMDEITNTTVFNLDFTQVDNEPRIGQKLSSCIPEIDLSIVPNTVICGKCADTINSLYIFKKECLQLEMQIHEYIQQVQHTDNAVDLAAVTQYHQLHSKNLTVELKAEAFEKTENYKNEESPSYFCDNYAFNETERYTEVVNSDYLTPLAKVERRCVLFNTIENFSNLSKSEAEQNSDTHDVSNIVQDCLLQVVENPDSCIQNLNKTDTCGQKAESKLKLIRHLKNQKDNKLVHTKIPSKSRKSLCCWYKCDLCNYSTKYRSLFSFHNRAHLTKKDYRHILKSPILVNPSSNITTFGKKNNKENQCNILKLKMNANIIFKPFKCWFSQICDYSSNSKHNLKTHMLTHTGEKPFKCSICEYSCNHKSRLKNHILTHAGKKPFKCTICEYSYIQKGHLKRHMLNHTGEKPFKCSICEYSCNRKEVLKGHMLTHTGEKLFMCSVCEFSSNYKQSLKSHMLNHTGGKPFKCSICEYSFNKKNHLKSHLLIHTGEKPFKCLICEFCCNQKSSLKAHMLNHTGEKRFKCTICEYSFNFKSNLKSHMLTHTDEKPFKCSICEYSFNKKSSLKSHMLTHTGEKPFKCAICEYSFNRKSNLKSHMLTHTGEKPFSCSACEYQCSQKICLKRHMLNHTGEKPFKCSICEYGCNRKEHLKRHMLNHTGES